MEHEGTLNINIMFIYFNSIKARKPNARALDCRLTHLSAARVRVAKLKFTLVDVHIKVYCEFVHHKLAIKLT